MTSFLKLSKKSKQFLETLATYGSGSVLKNVIQVFVKLAKFSPIREPSYFDLPFRIREYHNSMIIRIQDYHNCFELCFTAAHRLKLGVDLLLTDQ